MGVESKTESITLPGNPGEYANWLAKECSCNVEQEQTLYETWSVRFLQRVEGSSIWQDFLSALKDYEQEYYNRTSLELFHGGPTNLPKLNRKACSSYFEKCFRYTFIKKELPKNLPKGREDKPYPSEYIGQIDDVVRTLMVVKFLDGVEFLIGQLRTLCEKYGLKNDIQYKSNDEGYFAAHFYIRMPTQLTDTDGVVRSFDIPFEIQISTQLQEVLRRFLHFQYEKSRNEKASNDVPWQWRYRDDDFFTNGLGHALRNIEGQIMEARRRKDIADANG